MKTLIIYDNEGYIISTRQGQPSPRIPVGVPYLYVEIPEGKRIKMTDGIGVDVTVTPHQVILEDIPPTEIEQLRLEMAQAITELFEMMLMLNGGAA